MRKRLIEKFTKAKEGSFGYTMTELLVVVAIIAIVAAIAIPSVIAISRALKFKRVNDHAKSIFLAAQQNLTEMRSDGGLKPLQKAGEEGGVYAITSASFPAEFKTEYVYTTTGTDAFELILPAGSVEATVRAEDIVIEYNPITGNVYAVFYCEEDDQNIASVYSSSDLPRNADGDKSRRKDMMLGYYDGSGLNSSQLELEEVRATVEFVNGEEGIVRVLVPVPDDFFGNLDEYAKAMTINLSVTGEYSMVQAAAGAVEEESGETVQTPGYTFSIPIKVAGTGMDNKTCYVEYGNTIVVEYPIDSLVNYGSFANYSSSTYDGAKNGGTDAKAHLTDLMDETRFTILPGENVTLEAEVKVDTEVKVEVENGILSGVNPMFEYLQPSGTGGYILAVSNGRNLQNLNAIAPTIAKQVDSVVFTSDIYWNDTVSYYNNKYEAGGTYHTGTPVRNADGVITGYTYNEAPARALPYFVPIHHEELFGTAKFIYPTPEWWQNLIGQFPDGIIKDIFSAIFKPDDRVPTLTDELDGRIDSETGKEIAIGHAAISGKKTEDDSGIRVYNLNIDATKYDLGKNFYAGSADVNTDRFTGLFGYVNTSIDNIHIVNPIIKGYHFNGNNNPATGALVGAAGYNAYISNCSVYIDKNDPAYSRTKLTGQTGYNKGAEQNWYGVSGEGAVGGLVGYAKSHLNVTGELRADRDILAFYNSFAAVNVSGNMRDETWRGGWSGYYGYSAKDYGYSNGVGGLVGNSQLTNFYNCYASGNVMATNTNAAETFETKTGGIWNSMLELFGIKLEFQYGGRESAGAGGFVGTSHGTRYTNCFATGVVNATNSSTGLGAGGFVGIMCIDETFAYGNQTDGNVPNAKIAQRTVFTNCYSVGSVTIGGAVSESFSGANCRVAFNLEEFTTAQVADYYRLLAQKRRAPTYEDFYIFKDTYYLSDYYLDNPEKNSNNCATPIDYDTLRDLAGSHGNKEWRQKQIDIIKKLELYNFLGIFSRTYEDAYFDNKGNLEGLFHQKYAEGFDSGWELATAITTHGYDLNGTYPFSKIAGLDYYGDWPAKALDLGVAYYESYGESETIYLHFDRESTAKLQNATDTTVTKDGYAILSSSNTAMTISVDGVSINYRSGQTSGSDTLGNKRYHIYILTDDQMKAAQDYVRTTGQYYVPITVGQDGNTNIYYFNPNVALSQVNGSANHTYAGSGATCSNCDQAKTHANHMPASKEMLVRSARQFAQINGLGNFLTRDYRYIQQLNINASDYRWANGEGEEVDPIGTTAQPFNASYSALYTDSTTGQQSRYTLKGFKPVDAGFFGVIGTTGKVENLMVECAGIDGGKDNLTDVAVLAGRNEGTISNVDMTITGNVVLTGKTNAGLIAGYSSGTIKDCDVTVTDNSASVNMSVKDNPGSVGGLIGFAEGSESAKTVVSNCTLNVSPKITVNGAKNVGGLIGQAKHLNLTATEPLVTMTELTTANAAYTGGLVGWMEDSEIKITDAENAVTVTADSITNSNGTAAGVLGGGKTVTLNSVDVKITKSISGDVAAGFLGSGTDIDASYCDVEVSGTIQGKTEAAGVAGTIGSQSVFEYATVKLGSGVSASAGDAAGYAVEISEEANVQNSSVTMNGTTIKATDGDAAGYACTLAGYVGNTSGSSVLCSVVGKGTITGKNAAGFACEITDQVSGAFVTPALAATKDAYKATNNSKLNVKATGTGEGEGKAAGFALTVGEDATVTNCYALNQITGASMTGFVGTNKGTITGCMANVTIPGGNAFVATNDGTVTRCYGWYGDGDPSKTETNAKVSGNVYSAYFVDLNPVDKEGKIVALYTPKGEQKEMTATELQGSIDILAGEGFTWYKPDVAGGYESYPYTAMPENMPKYLYPMLRDHYGDWILPPQYAYGVAYYEIHSVPSTVAEVAEGETTQPTTTVKLHMVDLSDEKVTEEGENGKRANYTDTFDNTGTIVKTGYAVFSKSGVNVLSSYAGEKLADLTYTLKLNDSKSVTYDFYELKTDSAKDGVVTIGATAVSKNTAAVQTWFADAINVTDNTYRVRTPEQLANVAQTAAASFNFSQTHDIAVTDFTTVEKLSGNYEGNELKLSVSGQTKTWMSTVAGTVQNLNLEIPKGVNAPVFGTVSQGANVTLSGLKIDAVGSEGALANVVYGTVTVPAISTPAVNGMLFGDKNGTVSTGTINTGAITVNGEVATLFGNVANVTVDGAIQTGKVNTQLFGDVSGTVSTGAINVTGTAAQVFGDVTGGSVTVASINTYGKAVNGNVFGEINGTVNVGTVDTAGNFTGGPITTGAVSGNVFGTVGAEVSTGAITTGNVTGNVFGAVTAKVTANGITAGTVGNVVASAGTNSDVSTGAIRITSGQVIGPVSGGKVVTGAITVDSVTENSILAKVEGGTVTLGDITINPVVTKDEAGNEITTYADVPTLIGPVSGGSVSGANVTLGNAEIAGSIFDSVTSGTVQNFNVTTTGAMNAPLVGDDLGGNLTNLTVECGSATVEGGILVKSVGQKAAVSGCTVKVTREAKIGGSNAGGLTGSNAGTLTDNTVNIGTVNTDGTVTGGLVVDSSNATVGGLVGVNTGKIGTVDENGNVTADNTSVTAYITYTPGSEVTIGGLIGENSGTVNGATVAGAIKLASGTGEGKKYIIGGAVGKDAGTAEKPATYANVTSTVKVAEEWGATNNNVASCPAGLGSVGKFVGYVYNGNFNGCSAVDGTESGYQFLGEIYVDTTKITQDVYSNTTELTLDNNGKYVVTSDSYPKGGTTYSSLDEWLSGKVSTIKKYPYVEGKEYAYNSYLATLNGCRFDMTGAEKEQLQVIHPNDYFYTAEHVATTNYSASPVNLPNFSNATTVSFSIFETYAGKGRQLTEYYYSENGLYYPVYVEYTKTHHGSWIVNYDEHKCNLYISGRNNPIKEGYWLTDYSLDGDKTVESAELHTLPAKTLSDGLYIITSTDGKGTHVLSSGDGTDVSAPVAASADFTNHDAIYGGLWNVSVTNGTWQSVKNPDVYLKPSVSGLLGASETVTYSAYAPNGCANGAIASFKLSNGGKYVNYASGNFAQASSVSAQINLYTAEEGTHYYTGTFTPTGTVNTLCTNVDVPESKVVLTEEKEIPAEEIGGETGNNT